MKRLFLPLLALALAAGACESDTIPTAAPEGESDPATAPNFAKKTASPDYSPIVAFVDEVNAKLAEAGSEMRLGYPWLFRVGPGTDPFGQLRTGTKWPMMDVGYILDESDYTTDVPFAEVDAILERSYDKWNDIRNSNLTATRNPDPGGNYDVLDGLYDGAGNCVFLFDITSPNIDFFGTGEIFPEDDIVVGGWLPETYFSQCLGDPLIIGITWFFSGGDRNGDNYEDQLYVEQFYNSGFEWTTTDAVYLDFDAPMDVETITVHENGHSHGLGHFGGPIKNQPFQLQPNGKVYNPTAVMNPGYLGGEQRELLATDIAAMRTMYARNR